MKVVLIQDIPRLGKKNDILDVADGYGNNFLIKRGLARPATEALVSKVRGIKAKAEEQNQQYRSQRQSEYQALHTKTITIAAKTNSQGQLFGAIHSQNIIQLIQEQYGLVCEKHMIRIPYQIKSLGTHPIEVVFLPNLIANISLNVTAENSN